MKWVLYLLTVLLIVLHQDFWNWGKVNPLLFDFMPVGLWYHLGYCVAASVLLGLFVAFLWPKHLEDVQPEPGMNRVDAPAGH